LIKVRGALKVAIIVVVAIVVGLVLYSVTPSMGEGLYEGKAIVHVAGGREFPVAFNFTIGVNAVDTVHEEVVNVNGEAIRVVVKVPAVKTIKLGTKLNVEVLINNTELVELSKTRLVITTESGNSFTYIPVSVSSSRAQFSSTILYKTKEAAFVFGSALVLFIGASVVPYVITSIYSTLALYLLGALALKDPFTMYMSDTCLVFLAGSAFELVLINTGLADRIASALRAIASSPSKLFMGTFILSGFLSMWMSNTSATYLLLPIISAIAMRAAIEGSKLYELVLIGLATGATCGGMATIIGTPPNLIASGYINNYLYGGKSVITFANWLYWGLPLFIIGSAIAYAVFTLMYRSMGRNEVDVVSKKLRGHSAKREPGKKWSPYEVTGLATVLFLVALWVTEPIHGIKTGVAGVLGLLVFLATRVLRVQQVKDLSWDIVILMGAGLTLGKGLMDTGFSDWLAQFFARFLDQPIALMWLVGFVALVIGTVISSHTSAAAFIAPIMAPIGYVLATGMALPSARLGSAASIIIATCCINWAVALPISTPPSAIVFGTGKVRVKTLATFGLIWGVTGTILTLLIVPSIVFNAVPI